MGRRLIMPDQEELKCPVCGKKLTKSALSGHLAMVHDYKKPEDLDQYEFAEAVKSGKIELDGGKSKVKKTEEGSKNMEEESGYLDDLLEGIESRSGYYKDPKKKKTESKTKKESRKSGGEGSFFPSLPGLDWGKWGKRLAIAGLATGSLVYLSKNWEGISDRLQEANETEDQSVNAEDVKDSGKDNGKKEPESSPKNFARISDL